MDHMAESRVYVPQPGRRFEDDDAPVADVLTKGAEALLAGGDGSPLSEFNKAFVTLRKRLNRNPLTGETLLRRKSVAPEDPSATSVAEAPDAAGMLHVEEVGGAASDSESEGSDGDREVEGDGEGYDKDGSGDEGEPELGLTSLADVGLHGDSVEVWDDDGVSGDEDEDEEG